MGEQGLFLRRLRPTEAGGRRRLPYHDPILARKKGGNKRGKRKYEEEEISGKPNTTRERKENIPICDDRLPTDRPTEAAATLEAPPTKWL